MDKVSLQRPPLGAELWTAWLAAVRGCRICDHRYETLHHDFTLDEATDWNAGTFKNAVGKPRPDFIDRCQPVRGSHDPVPFGLSNSTICTQTDQAIMKDGFRSFPSGHSSTSFAGLFYLSLYLAAKLHILDSKGEVWKVFVCLIPTLGAGLIAATRIMDARHHPFDVISGSLLGVLCAWVAYRQYFPPIHETWRKGRAYPIRSWSQESLPPPPQRVGKENMYSGFENATQPRITVSHSRQDSEAPLTAPAAEPASESRPESGETLQPSTYSRPGRHRREDSYEGYSSSDAGDEYELRPGYTLGDQRRQMYDRVQEQLSGDISYHSPAQQAENV